MKKTIHFIAFNVPFPPDYGGAMDMWGQLLALHKAGVNVVLHCFQYDRPAQNALLEICSEVHYYQRKMHWWRQLSTLPFIVNSRDDKTLLERLLLDDFPILFQGTHTCKLLAHPLLQHRKKVVRVHNLEWRYYYYLYAIELNIFRKLYYWLEHKKLYFFENKQIKTHANELICIAKNEAQLLENEGFTNVTFFPACTSDSTCIAKSGRGNFALFHGDLSVFDNEKAAILLAQNVFSKIPNNCIIAGKNPSQRLVKTIAGFENVTLIANPSAEQLQVLMCDAQAHVFYSEIPSGMKLKLVNALLQGRFCFINSSCVDRDFFSEAVIQFYDNFNELTAQLQIVFLQEFKEAFLQKRIEFAQTKLNADTFARLFL